jgi:FixJ family two-component response regulator
MQMPGMNGIELQQALRNVGYTTSIVFITAFPDERIAARALRAGALGFLTKPFDEKSLIECLERASDRKGPNGA